MAIIEEPLALTSGEQHAERPLGVMTRPQANGSWKDWVSTVDHKKIGIMYGVAAMFFFLVGGLEALLIRTQLAFPENGFLSADVYNQIFTMHGVTMIFLFVMPFAAAFANYLIPLQIGARDVAFPRLNALRSGSGCPARSSSTRRGSSVAVAPTVVGSATRPTAASPLRRPTVSTSTPSAY